MYESVSDIVKAYNKSKLKFILFCGHKSKTNNGSIGKECLSQWYPSPFDHDGVRYATAEHWMMANKAKLFNDEESFLKIVASRDPAQVKAFGRLIKNYNEDKWASNRFNVVVAGNLLKFGQNPQLKDYLLSTEKYVLVEAAHYDPIWGIGLRETDAEASNPNLWKGQNLLGLALMKVRTNFLYAKETD